MVYSCYEALCISVVVLMLSQEAFVIMYCRLTALLSVCYTLQSLTTSTAEGTVNLSTSVERLVANLVSMHN